MFSVPTKTLLNPVPAFVPTPNLVVRDVVSPVKEPPLGADDTHPEPLLVRTLPEVPGDVSPVPPFKTGSAVPEYEIARVPAPVIGEPDTDKKLGTVAATDVTDPPDTTSTKSVPFQAIRVFFPVVIVTPVVGDVGPPRKTTDPA
jgi:hypothetical protein